MIDNITINKYLPFAFLYFFLNSFLLPNGLLYTAILTPFFLFWIFQNKLNYVIWLFFVITIPWACIHSLNGINILIYIKSYILLFTAYVFAITVYLVTVKTDKLTNIFKSLVTWNFFFTLVAILCLLAGIKDYLWYTEPISAGITDVPRLKLLTYEASYYSLLLAPIALYYYLKVLILKVKNPLLTLVMVTLPLVLSFSFGVLLSLGLAIFFLFWSDVKLFFIKKKFPVYIVVGIASLVLIFMVLLQVYPDNPLFKRMVNIFEGNDSSFRGRTTDSFFLGWNIAKEKSILLGAGLGQVKVLGMDLFVNFYQHSYTPDALKIPNALGETLAVFGILGLVIRLFAEVYMFFRTRVYSNYYRLSLFLFVFIYQFTGSFLNNIAEYVLWILAFFGRFPEFEKENIHVKDKV